MGDGLGIKRELRDWLRGAMQERAGRPEMSPTNVIEASKVGRSTFYGIYKGKRIPDQSTIDALASTLGVSAPTLVLRTVDDPSAEQTPLALVRSAEGLLKRAGEMLSATSSATGRAARAERMEGRGVKGRKKAHKKDQVDEPPDEEAGGR